MLDQTVLVLDLVAPNTDLEYFENLNGRHVADFIWYAVGADMYSELILTGKAGINAFDCYWIGLIEAIGML